MSYRVLFPSGSSGKHFQKELAGVPSDKLKQAIMDNTRALANNPYPFDRNNPKFFKKIVPPIEFSLLTASYRLRIGDYRVLYDVDDSKKIVWVLALRRRSEKTYR